MSESTPFWQIKSLDEMSDSEWESLCDGCGRCCMNKLEDEDTGEVVFTRVACKMLDTATCRCSDYSNRFKHVPDCISVRPLDEQKLSWLPPSCAYRLLSEGKPLEKWHPLISGTTETVFEAGISMQHLCLDETSVPFEELIHHVIFWDTGESDE